jgi:DNA-binding LacI/PurR family transcriptional regulator
MNPTLSPAREATATAIPERRNGPTIKDVARHAGVSHITVSRVMNGSPRVVPATAARVRAAAHALGYSPNMPARELVRGVGRLLGLLVSDTTSPFVAELVRAICTAADEAGYIVNICVTDFTVARELRALDTFIQHRIAGLVAGPSGHPESDARIGEMAELGLPVIALHRQIDHPAVSVIAGDSQTGSYNAAVHLLELGHRRIGYITGASALGIGPQKMRGVVAALASYGVHLDSDLVLASDLGARAGFTAAQALLRRPDPPTAIMTFNDAAAIGALSAAAALGIRVPEELSIIGFDDIEYAAHATPPLTTVHQPIADVGRLAARTLIEAVVSRERPAPVRLALDCPLIVRATTGRVQQR